jgi:hypothetical protein
LFIARVLSTVFCKSDISSYALDAVKALYTAGIINDKSGDKFDPKGNSTRAEAAAKED